VYIATGGDGFLRAFRAGDLNSISSVDLGDDADNVRVDAKSEQVYVGVGSGALAVLDSRTLAWRGKIPLQGHPEGFQLSGRDPQVFVNIPDAREIAVIDRSIGRQVARWHTAELRDNFPMAIDDANDRVIVAFRSPAKIVAFRKATGETARQAAGCSDADDVFVDAKRSRLYVICGSGFVDILQSDTLKRIARLTTSAGARTGLFDADADLLFVAARATSDGDAAVWVLKPND